MRSRKQIWALSFVGTGLMCLTTLSPSVAQKPTPGVAHTAIRIGQTLPYSGPASSFAVMGATQSAFYKMINDKCGAVRKM
jgi:branched-chain amino acid transport system substrate-binding protein